MSDSIRDRLKTTGEPVEEPAVVEHHGEHPVGDPIVNTHVSYHDVLRDDPRRAKRAERQISFLFMLSVIGTIGFITTYVAWPFEYGTPRAWLYTPLLGFFMALALLGIGAGAVHWAKTLMVDDETVQERHLLASTDEEKAGVAEIVAEGNADSGLGRRPLLRNTLILGGAALAVLPLPLFGDLGRYKHKERAMRQTSWRAGMRLLDEEGFPIKLGDLEVGGIKSVYPDTPGGRHTADSASILIRMRPADLHTKPTRKDWVVDGHVVYSMICTHLGCPVKLYEQQTHHLFCPCHQSTFDAADSAKVLFGPAPRNLPQLAIALDNEGYFVAQGDYTQPVGPSFWERKPTYPDKVV